MHIIIGFFKFESSILSYIVIVNNDKHILQVVKITLKYLCMDTCVIIISAAYY